MALLTAGTGAAFAGIHVAGERFHENISAVVGSDARAVHIHIVMGNDRDVAAAGSEDALGRIGIAERRELAADVQRAADIQIDPAEITFIGNLGGGHRQIADGGHIQLRTDR